jgi:hypothetical protein
MKKRALDLKALPPQLVSPPVRKYVRASREHAQRTVGVLLVMISCIVLIFSLLPHPTGQAISATRVNVTQVDALICDFPLYTGFNLVSFNCISNFENKTPVLNNTDLAKVKGIYEYQPTGSDRWKVYAPNLPSYVVHDLQYLSRKNGYAIVLYSTASNDGVYYEGYLTSQTDTYLYSGMNLAGYPSENFSLLPGALTTINDSYEFIRTYNVSNGWLEYANGSGGTLDRLTPTEGYWVRVAYDDIWVVDR